VTPIRERYDEIMGDRAGLHAVIADGAARAGAVARETMAVVRERIGFLPRPDA
jgi:tryptophanyl-tRNA synthetase